MSRRRRKKLLRYSPYIVIIGLASGYIIKTFAGEIIDDIKYQRLQAEITSEETEAPVLEEPLINGQALDGIIDSTSKIIEEAKEEIVEVEEETLEPEIEEEEPVVEEEVPEISDELLASGYEFKDINFDELIDINPEVDAWITLDNTNIDYPIMYAPEREDNYYLHRDIYGNDSSLGTLYIFNDNTSLNNNVEDISDMTLIFGHHIRGGRMFSQICNYMDQSYYDSHPYGIIYTPDGFAYKANFFAGIISPGGENNSVYYEEFPSEEVYDGFIEYLKENSTFQTDVEVNYGDKIIVLVTCEYTAGTNSRYYLYGVLDKQYTNEEQMIESSNNVNKQRVYK